jgi:hypothetical protein
MVVDLDALRLQVLLQVLRLGLVDVVVGYAAKRSHKALERGHQLEGDARFVGPGRLQLPTLVLVVLGQADHDLDLHLLVLRGLAAAQILHMHKHGHDELHLELALILALRVLHDLPDVLGDLVVLGLVARRVHLRPESNHNVPVRLVEAMLDHSLFLVLSYIILFLLNICVLYNNSSSSNYATCNFPPLQVR